jgi:hypothetical protein
MHFSAKVVSKSPSQFVTEVSENGFELLNFLDPSDTGRLQLRNYLCGNLGMGDENRNNLKKALDFYGTIRNQKVKLKGQATTPYKISAPDWDLMWKGQGYAIDFVSVMEAIWESRDSLKKYKNLERYLTADSIQDFLDKLNQDNIVGWDCIGFVYQYLYTVGVVEKYYGYSALGYLGEFKPVASLDEIQPLCVCPWKNNSHIVIIDKVVTRTDNSVTVNICQSSGKVKISSNVVITSIGQAQSPVIDSGTGRSYGSPTIFMLRGDLPVEPYVVIGKLPGLTQ